MCCMKCQCEQNGFCEVYGIHVLEGFRHRCRTSGRFRRAMKRQRETGTISGPPAAPQPTRPSATPKPPRPECFYRSHTPIDRKACNCPKKWVFRCSHPEREEMTCKLSDCEACGLYEIT